MSAKDLCPKDVSIMRSNLSSPSVLDTLVKSLSLVFNFLLKLEGIPIEIEKQTFFKNSH